MTMAGPRAAPRSAIWTSLEESTVTKKFAMVLESASGHA
jgi:hypothetical protein